jgi:hypothetical protein
VGFAEASSDERTPEGRAERAPYEDTSWNVESAAGSGHIDVAPLAGVDAALGAPLPGYSSHFHFQEIQRRSGTVFATAPEDVHLDYEAAHQEGLPAPVASAPHFIELLWNSALQYFGEGWIAGGAADITVVRPVYPGDYVTSSGFLKGKELLPDGSIREIFSVTVKNQNGEVKVAGTLSGIVK